MREDCEWSTDECVVGFDPTERGLVSSWSLLAIVSHRKEHLCRFLVIIHVILLEYLATS